MTAKHERVEQLKERVSQIKAQIKDIEQIQKQENRKNVEQRHLVLGRCVSKAVDDGVMEAQLLREILSRYVVSQKDRELFLNGEDS